MKTITTSIAIIFMIAFANFIQAGDTLRVMTYNLLNYGNITDYCTAANNSYLLKQNPLRRIVQYVQPDIFGVVELGANSFIHQTVLDSVMNSGGNKHYAKATYSNSAGSDLVSMLFYNDQKLALKSQASINTAVRDIVLYKLYYKSPDLAQTNDTAFINCIVAHLKAGSTTSDQQQRATMTLNAMNWIELNGGPGNYLFMGDFNVQSSSEQSYQNLINYTVTSLCFVDPISKSGNWNNNSSMAAYHTQSTHTSSNGCASTGGMDDRFDFILASAQVINGNNHVKYISNSYKAIGNDANHYNQAITDGTNNSAPASIIADLYTVSDHLPVVLNLSIDQDGADIQPTIEKSPIVILQNPVSDLLKLEILNYPNADFQLEIYNAEGRLFYVEEFTSSVVTIPAAPFNPGIYILKIKMKSGEVINRKIVKI